MRFRVCRCCYCNACFVCKIIILVKFWWIGLVVGKSYDKEEGSLGSDDDHDGPSGFEKHPPLWRHRETHHTTSSVMIADNHATIWIYSPSHSKPQDPVNTVLKYRPGTTSTATAVWKYEFSCPTLPTLALAHSKGEFYFGPWAVPPIKCPSTMASS
jgi:hypothetical protein